MKVTFLWAGQQFYSLSLRKVNLNYKITNKVTIHMGIQTFTK